MSASTEHECDNCGDLLNGRCYCKNCLDQSEQDSYKQGFEEGKKEGLAEGLKSHEH